MAKLSRYDKSIENCIISLKKSIELDEEYKNDVIEEGLFNSISNLKEFVDLVYYK